jgi:hypothetical protein
MVAKLGHIHVLSCVWGLNTRLLSCPLVFQGLAIRPLSCQAILDLCNKWYLSLFLSIMVLEFELRASCLLGRCSTLSYAPRHFFVYLLFSGWVFCFPTQSEARLKPRSFYLHLPYSWDEDVYYHAQLLDLDGVSLTFCLACLELPTFWSPE